MSDEQSVGVALENRLMSHGIYVTAFEQGDRGQNRDTVKNKNKNENGSESETTDRTGKDTETHAVKDALSGDEQPAPIELEYETVSEAPGVTSNEVGAVLRSLLAVAEEHEWQPGRLEALSLTTDGDRRGSWHVEAAWFEGLSDELSQVEFSQRVLETISQE
ncbi:hypothetical protein C483_03005 [Natrialba hulunbeirensis JCM 10989]|uniref:DUF8159 domain-containing protein n=1 Tax=Natrialba hulunbeirensis JCM 10989 TaxID=1227493 RepID=M0A769_9EURY|nr:hypothetical protein [Natrialba hulunbeirensis]ELY94394.1 hypothetical protein C483_03005 [Natrialba hulunbeirensis JCM 10989]